MHRRYRPDRHDRLAARGDRGQTRADLIPDYHLYVIREDQVVETVAEGLDQAFAEHSGLLTTIAGSSSTADIEMNRIKGVHGRRALDVILVAA